MLLRRALRFVRSWWSITSAQRASMSWEEVCSSSTSSSTCLSPRLFSLRNHSSSSHVLPFVFDSQTSRKPEGTIEGTRWSPGPRPRGRPRWGGATPRWRGGPATSSPTSGARPPPARRPARPALSPPRPGSCSVEPGGDSKWRREESRPRHHPPLVRRRRDRRLRRSGPASAASGPLPPAREQRRAIEGGRGPRDRAGDRPQPPSFTVGPPPPGGEAHPRPRPSGVPPLPLPPARSVRPLSPAARGSTGTRG